MSFRHGTFRSAVLALGGAVSCALGAAVCLVAAWWVVFQARMGPVAVTLTDGHGIHTGDAVGVGYAALGLGLIVWATTLWDDAARTLRRAHVEAARNR